eukprot:UN16506
MSLCEGTSHCEAHSWSNQRKTKITMKQQLLTRIKNPEKLIYVSHVFCRWVQYIALQYSF